MRTVCLLGASGSIGAQTLDVLYKSKKDFTLLGFSVGSKTRKIKGIVNKFPSVSHICIKDRNKISYFKSKYPHITFFSGDEGLIELIKENNAEMVVNALVGYIGFHPSLEVLKENKILALANKESLVVGGELINDLLKKGYGKLYPIDSEHVALSKCLKVENKNVKKLILTASGGAFRNLSRKDLIKVTKDDALKHPTWKMGAKITIDCATMVNKAFEIIEAHYLFNFPSNKIDIVLHDQSYIHSMVLYNNNFYRLDTGKPDMRKPIKYALYETNIEYRTDYVSNYLNYPKCTFHKFDIKRYPMVKYAKKVINEKGLYGAIFNASNEVAVNSFLKGKISFLKIEKIISYFMENIDNITTPSLEEIDKIDAFIRKRASEMIMKGEF